MIAAFGTVYYNIQEAPKRVFSPKKLAWALLEGYLR